MQENKRDWLGDIFLWSLGTGMASLILSSLTGSSELGKLAGFALSVFGIMCGVFLILRIGVFFTELRRNRHR